MKLLSTLDETLNFTFIKRKIPFAIEEEQNEAHAYAYGGAVEPVMGIIRLEVNIYQILFIMLEVQYDNALQMSNH
jgi:hypothetical protein